jgi:hypothetical protein
MTSSQYPSMRLAAISRDLARFLEALRQNVVRIDGLLTGGGSTIVVKDGGSVVSSAASVLDFGGTEFAVTESPSGEANVVIDTIDASKIGGLSNQVIPRFLTGSGLVDSGISDSGTVIGVSRPLAVSGAAGGTYVAVSDTVGAAQFIVSSDAGQYAHHWWQDIAGLGRWNLFKNNTAEGGSDAGSDLILAAYTDAGVFKYTVLQAYRADGRLMLPRFQFAGPSPVVDYQYTTVVQGKQSISQSPLRLSVDPGPNPSTFQRSLGFANEAHTTSHAAVSVSSDTFRLGTGAGWDLELYTTDVADEIRFLLAAGARGVLIDRHDAGLKNLARGSFENFIGGPWQHKNPPTTKYSGRTYIEPPLDRLRNVNNYNSVTFTNVTNGANLFHENYDQTADIAAGATGTIEVDFDNYPGYTVDTNTGFIYALGELVLHWYTNEGGFTELPSGNVKVELYRPSGGTDAWFTTFDAAVTYSPIIIPTDSAGNYIKKLKVTITHTGGTDPTRLVGMRWYVARYDTLNTDTSTYLLAHSKNKQYVTVDEYDWRDTSWVSTAALTGMQAASTAALRLGGTAGPYTERDRQGMEWWTTSGGLSLKWLLYSPNDANLYVRDVVNSRMQLQFNPGSPGSTSVGTDFLPLADASYDLGSGSLRFVDLFLSGKATVGGELEVDGALNHDGNTAGLYNVTPVARAAALTAADASTVDTTYGQEESDVINNIRTRVGEIETILTNIGISQ